MATTQCDECRRPMYTDNEFYPFCNEACRDEDRFRRARNGERTGDDSPRAPRRPGRLLGF